MVNPFRQRVVKGNGFSTWATFNQKKYNPQSEAMNVTAIAKVKKGKVIIIGFGA